MYGKVILTLALIAFVSLQFADSLKCYTCDNVASCKNPSTVNCDQAAANKTRDVLDRYYNGVKALNTKNFTCFAGGAFYKNSTAMAARGCIMKGAIECDYSLKNATFTSKYCSICNADKCNSVSAISSSVVTVISLFFVTKIFIM